MSDETDDEEKVTRLLEMFPQLKRVELLEVRQNKVQTLQVFSAKY